MLAGGELHSLVVTLVEASSNVLVGCKAQCELGAVLSLALHRTAQLVSSIASDSPFSDV